MLGGGYVNYVGLSGRSYKVIPQVQQRYRLNPEQLLHYYVRTAGGASVPLSTIVTGLAIGTLFTLFVVPAVYLLIAQDHARRRVEQPAAAGA